MAQSWLDLLPYSPRVPHGSILGPILYSTREFSARWSGTCYSTFLAPAHRYDMCWTLAQVVGSEEVMLPGRDLFNDDVVSVKAKCYRYSCPLSWRRETAKDMCHALKQPGSRVCYTLLLKVFFFMSDSLARFVFFVNGLGLVESFFWIVLWPYFCTICSFSLMVFRSFLWLLVASPRFGANFEYTAPWLFRLLAGKQVTDITVVDLLTQLFLYMLYQGFYRSMEIVDRESG